MKLGTRLFLSHGGVVVLALLIGTLFIYEGIRILHQRQVRKEQEQRIADFALAVRESLVQREDLAALNFMRSALASPGVVFASYLNRRSGVHLVLPREMEAVVKQRPFPTASSSPRSVRFGKGEEILEWSLGVDAGAAGKGLVRLGYSVGFLRRDFKDQTRKWLGLVLGAGAVALLVGLAVSLGLGRHLASPLRKIDEGTRQVREGQLDSLVEVNRKDEIGDLARSFNSMVVQLKELDEMKRDFTAGVTHDLGTPLHAIRSAINYLQAGDAGPLTQKQAEYLLMVSNSTANLTAFINNLLTTARIEAAKVDPYPEPLDVHTYVKEVVDLYQPQAMEKGITLSVVKKSPYISLSADATMFRQMVMNLLSNALKFTTLGSVEVGLSEHNGDFWLEVKDTGIGIDQKYHELVFEKFFRVRQPNGAPARQGSGLGLAIVKGLAEAHGGKVALESALGQGSLFRLILPKQPR